ncbi:MAG: Asp-tRNA(Asn)/Glu-tRNA(Gln) amidotransferase subunit GatB [Chitinophagales bacterium]
MKSVYDKYEIVIGLEVHAQLNTQSKIFAPDSAHFGAVPNTHISFITLGHPGTLPVLNEQAVESAVKMGLATNCKLQRVNRFSRKNYFYADLPKGYQITQFDTPICYQGNVDIEVEGETKSIRILQIHLEEDAGKSTHDLDPKYTMIDLNRAGVPLIEIVSEPDLRSGDEAMQYLTKIRQLVRYLGICDGNMEEGSLRCDANVSVRLKGETEYGQRTETKNMNSIRNVKRAIQYEAKRQIDLIERGERIIMQTLSFDANTGTNFPLRSKEMAHDYRYYPEPDLPPVVLEDAFIADIAAEMPALPEILFKQFTTAFGLSKYDASILIDDKAVADYYLATTQHTKNYKAVANWLIGPVKAWLKENSQEITNFVINPSTLAALTDLVAEGKVAFNIATHQLLPALIQAPAKAPSQLASDLNLLVNTNSDHLDQMITEVLAENAKQVALFKKGGKKAKKIPGFLMGQIMRKSPTKLDPKQTQKQLLLRLKQM